MRKGEVVSTFVWLPAVIIVTVLSLAAVYLMLSSIQVPKEFENTIVGNKEVITKNIASYAEECWKINVFSRLEQNEDCFLLHVVSEEYISREDILSNVDGKLNANDLIVETNIEKDKLYNLGIRFELTQKKIKIINVDKTTPDTVGPTIYDVLIEPIQSDESTFVTVRSNDSSGVVNETFAVHFILNENVVESKRLYNDGDNDLDGYGTDSNDLIANDATFSNVIYMKGKAQGAYDVMFTADDSYGNTGSYLIDEGFINCPKDLKWNGTECMVCIDDGVCKEGECAAGCKDCSVDLCCNTQLSGGCDKRVGENCKTCLKDCQPEKSNLKEGEKCTCNEECIDDLKCDKTNHCCPGGMEWDGSKCIKRICPETISQCVNKWHWTGYGSAFQINVQGKTCDYWEVCHHTKIKEMTEEIINCCDDLCQGNCHSLCNKALADSGLKTTDTPETRKKCYGLYAIYGGPTGRWLKGYEIHNEEPASIMLSQGTWMCTGYSIVLTTLLRSVGYEENEAFTATSLMDATKGHAFNILKFPGDSKYHIVDTVGNCPNTYNPGGIPGCVSGWPYCSYINTPLSPKCPNDKGSLCPSKSEVYGC